MTQPRLGTQTKSALQFQHALTSTKKARLHGPLLPLSTTPLMPILTPHALMITPNTTLFKTWVQLPRSAATLTAGSQQQEQPRSSKVCTRSGSTWHCSTKTKTSWKTLTLLCKRKLWSTKSTQKSETATPNACVLCRTRQMSRKHLSNNGLTYSA
jgi:hypothetical protein